MYNGYIVIKCFAIIWIGLKCPGVNIDTASWRKKNFSFSSAVGSRGGQKAHKLEGEL